VSKIFVFAMGVSFFLKKVSAKPHQATSGFTQAGVYARRNICANLEVCRPQEHLCSPRLREAATPLSASGESAVDNNV
jgi:hypothetical protein